MGVAHSLNSSKINDNVQLRREPSNQSPSTQDEAPGDGQSTWRILFELSLCVIQLLFQFIELKLFTKSFRAPVCLVLLHFPLLIIELQLKLIKLQLIQIKFFSQSI